MTNFWLKPPDGVPWKIKSGNWTEISRPEIVLKNIPGLTHESKSYELFVDLTVPMCRSFTWFTITSYKVRHVQIQSVAVHVHLLGICICFKIFLTEIAF